MMDKLISQQAAINVVSEITTTMSVCTNKDECYGMKRMQKQAITELANLPSVEPCGNVVSRNAIVQKLNEMDRYVSTELRLCDTDKKFPQNEVFIVDDVYEEIAEQLPSVQPTLYGYNIGHLELIARVLQKENLPPERVAEVLINIGEIVAIVRDEFEETLRKAVEDATNRCG